MMEFFDQITRDQSLHGLWIGLSADDFLACVLVTG
jgi:hypothetical protein